jgi:hypothetical protein
MVLDDHDPSTNFSLLEGVALFPNSKIWLVRIASWEVIDIDLIMVPGAGKLQHTDAR